jgi:hypothetical protein
MLLGPLLQSAFHPHGHLKRLSSARQQPPRSLRQLGVTTKSIRVILIVNMAAQRNCTMSLQLWESS